MSQASVIPTEPSLIGETEATEQRHGGGTLPESEGASPRPNVARRRGWFLLLQEGETTNQRARKPKGGRPSAQGGRRRQRTNQPDCRAPREAGANGLMGSGRRRAGLTVRTGVLVAEIGSGCVVAGGKRGREWGRGLRRRKETRGRGEGERRGRREACPPSGPAFSSSSSSAPAAGRTGVPPGWWAPTHPTHLSAAWWGHRVPLQKATLLWE